MGRKNMFELIEVDLDLDQEANIIEELLTEDNKHLGTGIEDFVNEECFRQWKYRKRILSTYDLREKLGIDENGVFQVKKIFIDMTYILIYIEYALNIVNVLIKFNTIGEVATEVICKNIYELLDEINHEMLVVDKENIKIVLVEKNPSATAVAELVEDDTISLDIIRYNHYLLKGDKAKKKKILLHLYPEFEKIRQKLKNANYNSLSSNLGNMFNVLVRHSGTDKSISARLVNDMNDDELEEWYDRLYDTFLTAILTANYINDKAKFDWFKKGDNNGIC